MNAPETRAATVLPHFALTNELVCVHSVARETGLAEATAQQVLPVYRRLGWTHDNWKMLAHDSKGLHSVSRLTPQFWEDADMLHDTLSVELDEPDLHLYQATLKARAKLPMGQEFDKNLQKHSVAYLGGVAVLSSRHEIKKFGTWIGATEGWSALITIQALRTSDTKSKTPIQRPLFSR